MENIVIIEILNYLENNRFHFLKKRSFLISNYITQSNMGNYKVQHLNLESLKELLFHLDNQTVENIFIQCYITILKLDKGINGIDIELHKVFSLIGEFRIEQLKLLVYEYNTGKITYEQLLPRGSTRGLKTSVKLRAIRLFDRYKSADSSKIDNTKLNKLNKCALKKVWSKVQENLEIINNPNTPKHIKAIAIGAIIYVLTPLDAIPDIVPIAGLVDDAAIVLMALDQINVLLRHNNKKGIKK